MNENLMIPQEDKTDKIQEEIVQKTIPVKKGRKSKKIIKDDVQDDINPEITIKKDIELIKEKEIQKIVDNVEKQLFDNSDKKEKVINVKIGTVKLPQKILHFDVKMPIISKFKKNRHVPKNQISMNIKLNTLKIK